MRITNSLEKEYWFVLTISTISTITLLFMNSLAFAQHINGKTIGIVNTTILGTCTVFCLFTLLNNFDKKSQLHKSILLTALVVLATLTSFSSLGIVQIFNATSVAWVSLPFAILAALSLIGFTISKCPCFDRERDD